MWRSNAVLRKINALHEKLALIGEGGFEEAVSRGPTPVLNTAGARRGNDARLQAEKHSQQLRSLYEEAKRLAEDEDRTCSVCLDKLDVLLAERPKKRPPSATSAAPVVVYTHIPFISIQHAR